MIELSRRELLAGAGAAPAVAGARWEASNARSQPPNIVLILVDQMTPFMTGPYGQRVAHTPNLDRLARAGSVLENAYCNSPLCVPSRTSMFSGRLPSHVAGYDNASEFPAAVPTFLHYLRRAGYFTAVAGKTHFVGPDQFHGFDERLTPCIYPADFGWTPDWRKGPVYNSGTSIQNTLRAVGPSKWNRQLAFDQMTFDRGMHCLRRHAARDDGRPIFLNFSFTQPHDPFTSTQRFLDLYRDAAIPMPKHHGDIRRLSPTYEWFIIHHGLDRETLPAKKIREARRSYLAMVSWLDEKVGLILDELRRLAMDKNTVVVFTSDHGEMLGEHGQWSKRVLLEWSARVPMVISGPGIPAGRRIVPPVSLVDLFPTVLDLAGAKPETVVDGHSLMPLLEGRDDGRDREVICEYLGEGAIEPMRMIRRGQHKYIAVNGYPAQLFDLAKDPEETRNFAGDRGYAPVERMLETRCERDWDGPALKEAVMRSQQERILIGSMKDYGGAPKWDYDAEIPGRFRF